MKTEILPADHPAAIPHASDVLRHSGLVAFPTDTVYGLAALAFDPVGIERLYSAKGRNSSKAIAVLLADVGELDRVAVNLPPHARVLADRFWPGPLTLVVPRHPDLPDVLSPLPTVGLRIPNHPVALRLLRHTGPLAVTSANLSGGKNASTAQEVLAQLEGRIHLILDGGRTPGGQPSTVVDCTTPALRVLRAGPIREAQLRAAIQAGE